MKNLSNLPPGCTSADGGINHEYEAAEEQVLNMAIDAGLNAAELIFAMKTGIEVVKRWRPREETA